MSKRLLKYLVLCLLSLTVACKKSSTDQQSSILASAGNNTLTFEDLEGLFPEQADAQDSAQIINTHLERWCREQALILEARKTLRTNANIQNLVKDYENSLYLKYYEDQMLESNPDTVITEQELKSYYEANKSEFKLETEIARCIFIKIAKPVRDANYLDKLWKNASKQNQELRKYCENNAAVYFLNPNKWYKISDIKAELTTGEKNLQKNFDGQFSDNAYHYYLKVFETLESKKEAPFSYVEEQAKKFIMHQRNTKYLTNLRNQLYDAALKNQQIKITNK